MARKRPRKLESVEERVREQFASARGTNIYEQLFIKSFQKNMDDVQEGSNKKV